MKRINYLILLLAFVAGMVSCSKKAEQQATVKKGTTTTVNVEEFEKQTADSVHIFILDVRSRQEYEEGHIPGAILINLQDSDFGKQCMKKIPADKTVGVYCRSGFRSKTASKILNEAGYNVIHLHDGYNAWKEAGKQLVP